MVETAKKRINKMMTHPVRYYYNPSYYYCHYYSSKLLPYTYKIVEAVVARTKGAVSKGRSVLVLAHGMGSDELHWLLWWQGSGC